MTPIGGGPFFSVVIPVFNRTNSILPTLRSVESQTFTSFECIVVDDGSDNGDALAAIVESLDDDRFLYVRQENGGACSARNRGIDTARGPYIALLDSDDSFLPDKLRKSKTQIDECDADVLVFSQMIVERGLEKIWIRPRRGLGAGERVDEYLFCSAQKIITSTMVLPASVARRVRFDERLPSLQDADFAIRVANTGIRTAFIAEPLIIFDDKPSLTRVSGSKNYEALLDWLDRTRGREISERAYWACRGWHCARVATYSRRLYGIGLFLQSFIRRVYPLRQAVVVFAQVMIPQSRYQAIANTVVNRRGKSQVASF